MMFSKHVYTFVNLHVVSLIIGVDLPTVCLVTICKDESTELQLELVHYIITDHWAPVLCGQAKNV